MAPKMAVAVVLSATVHAAAFRAPKLRTSDSLHRSYVNRVPPPLIPLQIQSFTRSRRCSTNMLSSYDRVFPKLRESLSEF